MAVTVPFGENGGFFATMYFLFVPVSTSTGANGIGIFDTNSFDDLSASSTYYYRAEDITPNRYPVVRRIVLIYRDLGLATITVGVRGTNDTLNVVSSEQKIKIGTSGATGSLLTTFVDLQLSCFRPQVYIKRDAGAGPLSIVELSMIGEVEEVSL